MSFSASPYPPSSRERPSHSRSLHQPPNATRLRTPNALNDEAMSNHNANNFGDGGDIAAEEDPRAARWREHYLRTEARLASVLGGTYEGDAVDALDNEASSGDAPAHDARPAITPKKLTRTIDEDDYGDDEDDEDDDDDDGDKRFGSALMAYKTMPRSSRRLCRTLPKASALG